MKKGTFIKAVGLFALSAGSITALGACGPSITAPTAKYTLTFATGTKQSIVPIIFSAGERVNPPEKEPVKSGYAFIGWYETYHSKISDYAKDTPFDWSKGLPAKNFTLYAGYAEEGGEIVDEGAVEKYMDSLRSTSEANHLYYHYYRYGNTPASYSDWDVWAWPYKPDAGEGTRFDWKGRTQSADGLSATGEAVLGDLGGAIVDIDLTKAYPSGWDNAEKKMHIGETSFAGSTSIGLQIVNSATRLSSSGFWKNDGGNVYVKLDDYKMELNGGGEAYHVFVIQNDVSHPSARPITATSNPFDEDDGSNVTYGDKRYDDVDWSKKAEKVATSPEFLDCGVGYQIMVSSFADSDGDGFGDIYGIVQKLDYLKDLGVKALWLTPIQKSDSYHGYDITDYSLVDAKYGSSVSPNAENGAVSEDSALADYKLLIQEAHKAGMKVVMDLVLNHTSTSNSWFTAAANLDEEYRGFYQWGNHDTTSQINEDNYWYPYSDTPYSYYAKFGSAMPELNFSYVPTRQAVEEVSTYWAKEIGVDGFRLDAVKHIYLTDEVSSTKGDTVIKDVSSAGDYSSDLTKNLHFFLELKKSVSEASGKNVFFVGENFDGHAYHVAPYYEAFDSMFDFYTYFNLTSAAATGRKNSTNGYGTAGGFLSNTYPYTTSSDTNLDNSGGDMTLANNSAWNFAAVYQTYSKYRGDTAMPGCFTSNHDIARVINRVAGSGDSTGIQRQGTVTSSNYASMEKSANCVKIAELMFPGLTWIYYGDEIGMTGNFPSGKNDKSAYADLWYRQPMKWTSDGKVGDGSGTTSYYVTGSSMRVEMDEVNASSTVKSATEQQADSSSDFSVMKKFIEVKNSNPALIRGSFTAANYVSGALAANVLCFSRSYNGQTIKVAVNFNGQSVNASGLSGTVLASYNNATATSLPAYSAIVVSNS